MFHSGQEERKAKIQTQAHWVLEPFLVTYTILHLHF